MMRKAAFTGICLLLAACSRGVVPLAEAPLAGGGTVRELIPASGPAVVVVLRPGDALGCYQSVWSWREWERKNPGRFVLLFTAEPTEAERRQLVPRRIRPDGVLQGGAGGAAPAEHVFDGRILKNSTEGGLGPATARLEEAGADLPLSALLDRSHPSPAAVAAAATQSNRQR